MSKRIGQDDPVIGVLRCLHCGKRIDCRQSVAMRYVRTDRWPTCCRQIMRLYGNDQLTEEWPKLQPH
jgi:hypothetical protein